MGTPSLTKPVIQCSVLFPHTQHELKKESAMTPDHVLHTGHLMKPFQWTKVNTSLQSPTCSICENVYFVNVRLNMWPLVNIRHWNNFEKHCFNKQGYEIRECGAHSDVLIFNLKSSGSTLMQLL